jgi:tetratricopeptide (TPR) repeat protein
MMKTNRKLRRVLCAAAWVFAFFAAGLDAQEGRGSGRLAGTVVDEKGNPLEGASLRLEYLQFNNTMTAVSNAKGQWGFIGLGKGVISLTISKEGFLPSTIQLDISGVKKNPEPRIVLKKPTGDVAKEGLSDASKEILLQGNALFEQKRYAEALALYQRFREKYPDLSKVGLNVANCYIELQDYDKAIAEYQKVLESLSAEPPDKRDAKLTGQIYAGIGDAYLRQNKFAEAEQNFKRSIDIDPADQALAYNVAEIMMQAGNADEAIRYYEMAIRIKPDWPKPYLKLGYAWLNKGNIKTALEIFNKCVEIGPAGDPDAALAKDILKKIK